MYFLIPEKANQTGVAFEPEHWPHVMSPFGCTAPRKGCNDEFPKMVVATLVRGPAKVLGPPSTSCKRSISFSIPSFVLAASGITLFPAANMSFLILVLALIAANAILVQNVERDRIFVQALLPSGVTGSGLQETCSLDSEE